MLTQSAANNYRSGGASEKIDVPRFPFKTSAARPPQGTSQSAQPAQPTQPAQSTQPTQPSQPAQSTTTQSKQHSASLPGISRTGQKLPPVERKPDPNATGSAKPGFPPSSSAPPANGSGMSSPPTSMKVDQNVAPNLLESGEIPIEPFPQQHSLKMSSHDGRKEIRYSPY
eukprot:TRINITY_DN83_c0_g1_i1.p2 TRINITY_DN83_c0_g1~~TRINITY_DN83_c0_g1_i1.p2  ORF type:complete len:170 (-),score=38.63 TRINITY_DN83_c0_g1_i1:111-620(-)